MAVDYNVFRILGDISHTLSKFILIWAIHRNKSAEGVSLITQALYLLVFAARYIDLLWTPPSYSYWNFTLKIVYISTSAYILFLMLRVYARTREREKAWRLGAYSLGGSVVLGPLATMITEGKAGFRFFEMFYTFTLCLEAFCILPQLLLLRQTTVPTVLDSFYLVALGSYRALYILNWILRGITSKGHLESNYASSFIFGVIQTAFYFDFAWVYWSRQRVKLRAGAVVDSEDLGKGWLVSKIIGNRRFDDDAGGDAGEREGLARQEEGHGNSAPRTNRWGARGISVSADDGVREAEANGRNVPPNNKDVGMTDPDAFEDDLDDDPFAEPESNAGDGTVNSAGQWRDNE